MKFIQNKAIGHGIALALVFGLLASTITPVFAQTPAATPISETRATYETSDCMYDLPDGLGPDDVGCGWVTAPLYPDGSQPGSVRLPVIKVLATTDTPAPDPLLILLGGPGQNMSAVLPLFGDEAPYWSFMRERQDVILFDQRGMGKAEPSLACSFERDGADMSSMSQIALGFGLLRCGAEIVSAGIDPAAFTTTHNAADIEAIRIAMGYEQINLYGISYGSTLALSAIRDYPQSIRASIIASPLPQEANPMADQTIGFAHALEQLWQLCADNSECAEANPDPARDFERAVARLRTQPMAISTINPETGAPLNIEINNVQFLQIIYMGVFVGPLLPLVPYLVTSVANGDDSMLQLLAPLFLTVNADVSVGALFTYFCQDEMPFDSQSETRALVTDAQLPKPFTDGSWVGLADQLYAICGVWRFPAADDIETEPVTSDTPLLIFTGAFDPITPPKNGEMVHANFPNSQWVNFTAQGHDPASIVPECSGPIILGFLDDPFAPVHADCASMSLDFSTPNWYEPAVATPVAAAN